MTVKELIEELQTYPQYLQVFTQEEDRLFHVHEIKIIGILDDKDTGYCYRSEDDDEKPDYVGVLL